MTVTRPARGGCKRSGLIGPNSSTQDRTVQRWLGVERDDRGPFGTKSGSALSAHDRARRQGMPSRRKMRHAADLTTPNANATFLSRAGQGIQTPMCCALLVRGVAFTIALAHRLGMAFQFIGNGLCMLVFPTQHYHSGPPNHIGRPMSACC